MIIVTGGSGVIGQSLISKLLTKGKKVVSISRSGSVAGAINIKYDLTKPVDDLIFTLLALHESVEGIVHLAAAHNVHDSQKRPWYYYEQNLTSTANVISLALQTKADWIEYASTCMVYQSSANLLCEIDEQSDLFLDCHSSSNPYAHSKYIGEHMLSMACSQHHINLGVFRIFNVFAPTPPTDQSRSRFMIPNLVNCVANDLPFDINRANDDRFDSVVRDYVHVDDVAQAFYLGADILARHDSRKMMTHKFIGNVGTGTGTSVISLIDKVQLVTGKKLKFTLGPERDVPACLVANNHWIMETLQWQPKYTIEDMIKEQWNFYEK